MDKLSRIQLNLMEEMINEKKKYEKINELDKNRMVFLISQCFKEDGLEIFPIAFFIFSPDQVIQMINNL